MEFESAVHQESYTKVAGFIRDLFGEYAVAHDNRPTWSIPQGSTVVHVTVSPWGDDDATVCVRAYVIMDVEIVPELMHYLLTKNNEMRFGGFGLDTDNDIFFEHTIVATTCNKDQVKASVLAVLWSSDQCDDEIQGRWGGRKAMEED